jgi:uncharacterized protein (DUF433 family)
MDYSAIITTNPAVRSGKSCIRDTRVTVSDVLALRRKWFG